MSINAHFDGAFREASHENENTANWNSAGYSGSILGAQGLGS